MATLETPAQLASRVGVSVATIRSLIRDRKLDHVYTSPGCRIARIPAGAWERYLDEFTVRAVADIRSTEHAQGTTPRP